jgi:hypothetical protein
MDAKEREEYFDNTEMITFVKNTRTIKEDIIVILVDYSLTKLCLKASLIFCH